MCLAYLLKPEQLICMFYIVLKLEFTNGFCYLEHFSAHIGISKTALINYIELFEKLKILSKDKKLDTTSNSSNRCRTYITINYPKDILLKLVKDYIILLENTISSNISNQYEEEVSIRGLELLDSISQESKVLTRKITNKITNLKKEFEL